MQTSGKAGTCSEPRFTIPDPTPKVLKSRTVPTVQLPVDDVF